MCPPGFEELVIIVKEFAPDWHFHHIPIFSGARRPTDCGNNSDGRINAVCEYRDSPVNLTRAFFILVVLALSISMSACAGNPNGLITPTSTRSPVKDPVAKTPTSPPVAPTVSVTLAATREPKAVPISTLSATPNLCTANDSDFVADVTIPDGTAIKPGAQFTKTWRLRNTGRCTWDAGYRLAYVDGPRMTDQNFVELTQETQPKQTADISVVFTAPRESGAVKSRWQMQAPNGARFGKKVFVQIYAGTSPIDPIVGVWQGMYAGGADAEGHSDQVSGEQEIEIRAVCRNGQPCIQVREAASTIEYSFDPKWSKERNEYCFSDGFQGYCFSLQQDGTLKFEAGGPGYGVSGTLRKVSD